MQNLVDANQAPSTIYFSLYSVMAKMTSLVFSSLGGKKSKFSEEGLEVDYKCCFSCFKWLNSVAMDGGRCLATNASVRPGKDDKNYF